MARRDYAVSAAWCVATFLAITAAAPHVIMALSFCSEAACETTARSVARGTNFVFFGMFLVTIASISVQRVRDLKFPAYCGLIVPALMLADAQYGLSLGGPLTVLFVLRSLLATPYYMIAGLACIAFLASMEAPISSERFGRAGRIAFGLTCFIATAGLLQLFVISGLGSINASFADPFIGLAVLMHSFAVTCVYVLTGLITYLIWLHNSWGESVPPPAAASARRNAGSRAVFGQRR